MIITSTHRLIFWEHTPSPLNIQISKATAYETSKTQADLGFFSPVSHFTLTLTVLRLKVQTKHCHPQTPTALPQ